MERKVIQKWRRFSDIATDLDEKVVIENISVIEVLVKMSLKHHELNYRPDIIQFIE